jgi:mycothiol synthase
MATRTSTGTAILLPDSPTMPGLSFRLMDMDADVPALADLICEAHLADGIDWLPTVDGLRVELEHQPNFKPAQDLLLAELDGKLVGATHHAVRVRDGQAVHEQSCWVRSTARRRGIGTALLNWSESRSREAAAEWTGSEPHVLSGWVDEREAGAIALLEAEGYGRVRYGFMMVRSLADPIADAPLPDGLELRPVVEADHRRIWDADSEAFRDHWGAMTRTEEDYVGWFATPEIDTSLWRVAWDGDEVAGSVMPFVFPDENERLGVSRGWLEHISVRRPWRRRGLASALIVDSLRALRERGIGEAALGVDGENVSGALRIYESLGFRRYQTDIAFRKPL